MQMSATVSDSHMPVVCPLSSLLICSAHNWSKRTNHVLSLRKYTRILTYLVFSLNVRTNYGSANHDNDLAYWF